MREETRVQGLVRLYALYGLYGLYGPVTSMSGWSFSDIVMVIVTDALDVNDTC